MKPSVAAKLVSLVSRARELDALLGDPGVTSNLDNYRRLTKEHGNDRAANAPRKHLDRDCNTLIWWRCCTTLAPDRPTPPAQRANEDAGEPEWI